jgi:branched-chain amino acid transport system substrate-binding protein
LDLSTRTLTLRAGLPLVAMLASGCGGSDGGDGAGRGGESGGAIKIGVLVPLTGESASAGTDMLNAAKLAVDEINDGGGVLGRQLEIVSGDDGCDPQTGTAAAQKLAVSGIVGVAGGYCSGAAIPETVVLDQRGIPYISAAATSPTLTERGLTTVFRAIGRDDQQGPFAAKFLSGHLGAKKLAIIHDNTTYAKGLAEQTRDATTRLGGATEVVFFDAITPGERDYTSTLTKVKATRADVLYFTGYFAEAGLIVRQGHDLDLTARLTGGDATQDPTLIETAGPSAEGFIATTAPLPQFLPSATAFVEGYTARFGAAPGPYSVYEYDAVKVLAGAVERAGAADPKKVAQALRTTQAQGLTGEIAFDDKGDRKKTVYVTAIVKDRRFTPYKKLDSGGNWVDA